MTLPLEERALKALHDKMVQNLPQWIDTVNAEFTDPLYPLEQVDTDTQVLDFMPSISYLTAFPTFAIAEGEIEFQDDTGWSATGVMPLHVILYCQSFDLRALAWQLRRYMIAAANCVVSGRSLGEGWGMRILGVTPGPKLRLRDQPDGATSGQSAVLGMRALSIEMRDEQDA